MENELEVHVGKSIFNKKGPNPRLGYFKLSYQWYRSFKNRCHCNPAGKLFYQSRFIKQNRVHP